MSFQEWCSNIALFSRFDTVPKCNGSITLLLDLLEKMTRLLIYEYTLRYPSQNEGRGCGGGGTQIREWTKSLDLCIHCATSWARRELNSITKIRQQLIANNSKNTTVYTIRFADFLIHIARG
jgi:hypothetical protein